MQKLSRIVFVALDGCPPADETLDALPDPAAVADIVRSAFSPFLIEGGTFETLDGGALVAPPAADLVLVYAYGHAWLRPDGPQTSTRVGGSSALEGAAQLLTRLIPTSAADRTVLILDCCHAAAFDPFMSPPLIPRLVVYASGTEEKAIALTAERASRLSLVFAERLSARTNTVDLVGIVTDVAERLNSDSVLRGQTVSYRMNGRDIKLVRGAVKDDKSSRERTVTMIRNAFIGLGAVAAVCLIALGWYLWTHTLVEVDVSGLASVARDIRLVASEENPSRNGSSLFASQPATGNRIRLWVPAANIILRIQARYADGVHRALGYHLDLSPSFNPAAKSLTLRLPTANDIQTHPGMAFVPEAEWFHGRELEPRTNARSFWIDIRPPTVAEYLKMATALLNSGQLNRENSFVLTARQRSAAIDAVGLDQLRTLNRDLGAILGAIEAANSPHVGAPSDVAVGLGELPCEICPAPMTRFEAELFCKSRNMRLPTDLEWELAVRGVDGRTYPWGNQFDERRANVPGLPAHGAPSPTLKPVDAHPNERSPFGLIDTVGNAGDWVINESGSYERVYMGATYRYNQEDATAFRMLPVTDEDYLVREITARCVADTISEVRRLN